MLEYSKIIDQLEITLDIKEEGGVFIANKEGHKAGEMTFYWEKTPQHRIMVIDHTRVSEGYNGHGIGKKLVLAGAEWAMNNALKVRAVCPFALKIFTTEKEIEALLE